MEYPKEFEPSFMRRTLEIVNTYEGELDATLLINCLLGLLVVPRERTFDRIPEDPIANLLDWGIDPSGIHRFSKLDRGDQREETLRDLVHRMRNSVAHFRIEPLSEDGVVTGFRFQDRNGFYAEIPLGELRDFVRRLADHLDKSLSSSATSASLR